MVEKKPPQEKNNKAVQLAMDNFIKAETNLERLPFFAPWTKSRSAKTEHSLRRIRIQGDVKVEVSWTVYAHPKFGYPNSFDLDVYRALQQLIHDKYADGLPESGVIAFSFRQIFQRMRQSPSGRLTNDIRASLERLVSTTIKSKGAFYYKETRQFIDDTFHIFDRVTFVGQTLPGGDMAETNYLQLSSWYRDSLRSWYVMPLDNNLHFGLRSSSAKALYGILSFYFYSRPDGQEWIRRKYSDLCEETIITRQPYFSTGFRHLQNAFKELINNHFLSKVEAIPLSEDNKNDGWIYFWPGDRILYPERFLSNENQPMLWDEEKPDTPALPPALENEETSEKVANLVQAFYSALNKRKLSVRKISQIEYDSALQWIREHGEQNFSRFTAYALEQKETRWPDMASLTGAINAYGDEFLKSEEQIQQQIEQKQQAQEEFTRTEELKEQYRLYLDRRLSEIQVAFPEIFDRYQKTLHTNPQYLQICKSIQDGGSHWNRSKGILEANIATKFFSPNSPIPEQAYILDFVDWCESTK